MATAGVKGLKSRSTHYKSFQKRASQPISWLVQISRKHVTNYNKHQYQWQNYDSHHTRTTDCPRTTTTLQLQSPLHFPVSNVIRHDRQTVDGSVICSPTRSMLSLVCDTDMSERSRKTATNFGKLGWKYRMAPLSLDSALNLSAAKLNLKSSQIESNPKSVGSKLNC